MLTLKTFKRLALATALLISPQIAHAQNAPATSASSTAAVDADPALWVVKDEDTTVYLFGTVHLLKPGLGWFDEAVRAAFDKSDEIVLELADPDPQQMQGLIMQMGIDMSGDTLRSKLSPEAQATLVKVAQDLGVPIEALDRFKPWLAAIMTGMAPLQKLGYAPNSGVEKIVAAAAREANKPIIGLETAEEQFGFFDSLPEAVQIDYLTQGLAAYEKIGTVIEKMVAQWAAGDADGLGETLNEEMRKTPALSKPLLADRNARWANWIEKRLDKPGTVFVAVGAGHLAGAESVQDFLSSKKLTVTRISY